MSQGERNTVLENLVTNLVPVYLAPVLENLVTNLVPIYLALVLENLVTNLVPIYLAPVLENLVTNLVPSEMVCFKSSPWRMRWTAVWIFLDEMVNLLE
jgi:hypothetical protein